jgi:hypothetical protein
MRLSKNFKIIYSLVGLLLFVGFLLKFSLNIWGHYTIGKIERIALARGTKVSYSFYYEGKPYKSMITEPMQQGNVGKHFFVVFLKPIPSINILLPDKPAEKCINNFKQETFDTLPSCN